MTARLTNKFQTSLTEPIAADSDNIKIIPEDIERLPVLTSGDWCPLNITDPRGWEEIVHVTKIGENGTLTVKRGMEGTTARTFQLNSRVDMRLTAASIESFLGLYYGARTKAPDNAPLGSLYLDISKTPNVMMTLGANGWSPATSFSLAGLRQQTFIADEGAQGPFVVDGGFSTGYANINGLSIYPGHGMTIDATKSSFKLDAPVQKDTVIVFHGYLANDAVDVFTKTEVNKRFSDLTAANIAETNNRKFMTADERSKVANLDNTYLSKSGGTITGDLIVNRNIRGDSLTSNGWIVGEYKGDLTKGTAGVQLSCSQNNSYVSQFVIRGDGSTAIWMKDLGYVATFNRGGNLVIGNATYQSDGNICSSIWSGGHLAQHIENRCAAFADDRKNACVTSARLVGWAEVVFTRNQWSSLPTGYFASCAYIDGSGNYRIGGNQAQLYIANRGWFPIGG